MTRSFARRSLATLVPPTYVAVVTSVWLACIAPLIVSVVYAALCGSRAAQFALGAALIGAAVGATLPARCLRPHRGERTEALHRRLGVRRFRRIAFRGDLMNALLRRLGERDSPLFGNEERWAILVRWSLRNERIHWAWVLAVVPLVAWGCARGSALSAALALGAMIPLNTYPIALQRYTRGRLEAAIRSRAVRPHA